MAGRGFYERAMEAAEALDFAAAKELVDVQVTDVRLGHPRSLPLPGGRPA